jgi:hypothetical protein
MKKKLSMHPSAVRARKWRLANPEKAREIIRKASKKWSDANPERGAERSRKWRKTNPEKVRKLAKKWRDANPEKVKASTKKWRDANPERVKENSRKWRAANPERVKFLNKKNKNRIKKASATNHEVSLHQLVVSARARAKKHRRAFEIDLPYLLGLWKLQKGRCNLSNMKMTIGIGTKNSKVSIDRINSRKGYIKGNCQLVRADVNIAKNEFEQKEFIKMCKAVAKNN